VPFKTAEPSPIPVGADSISALKPHPTETPTTIRKITNTPAPQRAEIDSAPTQAATPAKNILNNDGSIKNEKMDKWADKSNRQISGRPYHDLATSQYFGYNAQYHTKKANMLSFLPPTPTQMQDRLRDRFRSRRKQLRYTQTELAERSGVSLGSLKRFEHTGRISLESLLKLAFVMECLGDFSGVCCEEEERFGSIEEIVNGSKK
jgi:DNA-binding XRE family transcriptional regulator